MLSDHEHDDVERLLAGACDVPPPRSRFVEQLQRDILRQMDAASPLDSPKRWTITMNRRTAAAAVIALAVVGLVVWPDGNNSGVQLAFAEVQEELQKTKSVSYMQTLQVEGQPVETYRCVILASGVSRVEYSNGDFIVYDPGQTKALHVRVKEKQATIMQGEFTAASTFDYYRELRRRRDDAAKCLGERKIDGRKAIGFRVPYRTPNGDDPSIEIQVWVDPTTRLPIRMQSTGKDDRGRGVQSIVSEIRFDEELDVSLFRLSPPPGFDVSEDESGRVRRP